MYPVSAADAAPGSTPAAATQTAREAIRVITSPLTGARPRPRSVFADPLTGTRPRPLRPVPRGRGGGVAGALGLAASVIVIGVLGLSAFGAAGRGGGATSGGGTP